MTISDIFRKIQQLNGDFAFYFRRDNHPPFFHATRSQFPSASLIKIPILLAWVHLERQGLLDRAELCDLDAEPPVQGAGFSWLLRSRRLPYQDVLLLMLTISDNHCTNQIIRRIGMQRLNSIFREELGLSETVLQRRMMDFEARARGLDNFIGAQDCIHLFDLFRQLQPQELAWIEPILLASQDSGLLSRDLPRDLIEFHHKGGTLPGETLVLNDWGYTRSAQIFLLTCNLRDEDAANAAFGAAGRALLP